MCISLGFLCRISVPLHLQTAVFQIKDQITPRLHDILSPPDLLTSDTWCFFLRHNQVISVLMWDNVKSHQCTAVSTPFFTYPIVTSWQGANIVYVANVRQRLRAPSTLQRADGCRAGHQLLLLPAKGSASQLHNTLPLRVSVHTCTSPLRLTKRVPIRAAAFYHHMRRITEIWGGKVRAPTACLSAAEVKSLRSKIHLAV